MTDAPDFVSQMIAWVGAATSWAALVIGRSKDRADVAEVVMTACRQVPAGLELIFKNVGGQPAMDVGVNLNGSRIGFTGGIASKDEWRVSVTAPSGPRAPVDLVFRRKGSHDGHRAHEIVKSSSGWVLAS